MSIAKGQLHTCDLYSQALIKTMRLQLYLPPQYTPADRRYPVVYLLHPWGATEDYWPAGLNFHEAADHLITAGAIPPFIGVMPQGDKSFFINAEDPGGDFEMITRLDPVTYTGALDGYGDYGDYLLADVIPYVERKYPVRADRSARVIAGVGMGATGAAALAFASPGVFGAVGIHSPQLFSMERPGPPWIFGFGDQAAFDRHDPVYLAGRLPSAAGLRLYLDCGVEDEYRQRVADLHYALVEKDIAHLYHVRPGGHAPDYWRQHLAEYLGFYAAGW